MEIALIHWYSTPNEVKQQVYFITGLCFFLYKIPVLSKITLPLKIQTQNKNVEAGQFEFESRKYVLRRFFYYWTIEIKNSNHNLLYRFIHSGDRVLYFDTLKCVEVFFAIQYHYDTDSGTLSPQKSTRASEKKLPPLVVRCLTY